MQKVKDRDDLAYAAQWLYGEPTIYENNEEQDMVINDVLIVDIVKKAREYEKTKSITTATDVCKMLVKWADRATALAKGGNDEQ